MFPNIYLLLHLIFLSICIILHLRNIPLIPLRFPFHNFLNHHHYLSTLQVHHLLYFLSILQIHPQFPLLLLFYNHLLHLMYLLLWIQRVQLHHMFMIVIIWLF
jgi:hypothetical protein